MNNIPDNEDIRLAEESRREQSRKEHVVGVCANCGEEVLSYEEHYNINGDLVHGDCVMVWLEQFRVA